MKRKLILISLLFAIIFASNAYAANTYTVSFDARCSSGEGGQTESITVEYGADMPQLTTDAPTCTGRTFTGWYDNAGTQYYDTNGTSVRPYDKTEDTTLYAKWARKLKIFLQIKGTTIGSVIATQGMPMPQIPPEYMSIIKDKSKGYLFKGFYYSSKLYYNQDGTGVKDCDLSGSITLTAGLTECGWGYYCNNNIKTACPKEEGYTISTPGKIASDISQCGYPIIIYDNSASDAYNAPESIQGVVSYTDNTLVFPLSTSIKRGKSFKWLDGYTWYRHGYYKYPVATTKKCVLGTGAEGRCSLGDEPPNADMYFDENGTPLRTLTEEEVLAAKEGKFKLIDVLYIETTLDDGAGSGGQGVAYGNPLQNYKELTQIPNLDGHLFSGYYANNALAGETQMFSNTGKTIGPVWPAMLGNKFTAKYEPCPLGYYCKNNIQTACPNAGATLNTGAMYASECTKVIDNQLCHYSTNDSQYNLNCIPADDYVYNVTLDFEDYTQTVHVTYGAPMPTLSYFPSKTGHIVTLDYYNADGTSAKSWDQMNDATISAQYAACGTGFYCINNIKTACPSGTTTLTETASDVSECGNTFPIHPLAAITGQNDGTMFCTSKVDTIPDGLHERVHSFEITKDCNSWWPVPTTISYTTYHTPGTGNSINNVEYFALPGGTLTTKSGNVCYSPDTAAQNAGYYKDCQIILTECNNGYVNQGDICVPATCPTMPALNIGKNVQIPLYAVKSTLPAIGLKYNDTICYANMIPGKKSKTMNIRYNGTVYHAE